MFIEDMIIEKRLAKSKKEAIDTLCQRLFENGKISDLKGFRKAVLSREAEFSCELAPDIFVPHAKSEAVIKPSLALMKTEKGERVYLLASNSASQHIKALAELSNLIMNE